MAARTRAKPEWVAVVPGIERRVIADVEGTRFAIYRVQGGLHLDYHSHPNAEMGVIISGGGTHRMLLDVEHGRSRRRKTVEVAVGRGDCYYIPPHVPHAFDSGPGSPTVCVDLLIDHAGGAPILAQAAPPRHRAPGPTTTRRRRRVTPRPA